MQCEKFEMLWNEALDARRAPEDDAELMKHAAECRHCAELLSISDALFTGLEARPAIEPPSDLAERVLAEFNRPAPRFTRNGLVFAVLAVAAAIAVVVGLNWQARPLQDPAGSNPGSAPEIAVETPPAESMDPFYRGPNASPDRQLGPVIDSLPGFNEEYLSVLRHTGTAVALFPGQVRRATEQPGVVADRLRPVTQPMTAALDALRRTLPGSASEVPEMPGMPDGAKSSSYSTTPTAMRS
jgi:hypothetical protein